MVRRTGSLALMLSLVGGILAGIASWGWAKECDPPKPHKDSLCIPATINMETSRAFFCKPDKFGYCVSESKELNRRCMGGYWTAIVPAKCTPWNLDEEYYGRKSSCTERAVQRPVDAYRYTVDCRRRRTDPRVVKDCHCLARYVDPPHTHPVLVCDCLQYQP